MLDLLVLYEIGGYVDAIRGAERSVHVSRATSQLIQASVNLFAELERRGLWKPVYTVEEHIVRDLIGMEDDE